MVPIPKVNFLTGSMNEFWGFVGMLLSGVSPWIMIGAAISAVGILIVIVVKAFQSSEKDKTEDDDIEVRHY